MEELILTDFDAEVVPRGSLCGQRIPYPACFVGDKRVTINAKAVKAFKPKPTGVKWLINNDYLFLFPTDERDRNAFSVEYGRNGKGCLTVIIPKVLAEERRMTPGYRKVFKYRDGIAFKRYEAF